MAPQLGGAVHDELYFGHRVTADDEAVYWAADDGTFPDASFPEGGSAEKPTQVVHRIMKLAK